MHKPLFAFFGTPHIATKVLDELEAEGLVPALVVTAPDKPAGRGLALTPSPVKVWALERGIDVAQPTTLKDEDFIAELSNTQWDVFVVAMYAKILPKAVLDIPTHGVLNVHPSLLPKFRGPSPVLSSILSDERTTGVTIMKLTEGMDEGPIVAQARIELDEEAWPPKGSEFEVFLSQEGGKLLAEVLPLWIRGQIPLEEQDHAHASYTKKFTAEDARINLLDDSRANYLKIRAFDKSPRPYFVNSQGKRVIINDAVWEEGTMRITHVTPEGKKEMSYEDYQRGQRD